MASGTSATRALETAPGKPSTRTLVSRPLASGGRVRSGTRALRRECAKHDLEIELGRHVHRIEACRLGERLHAALAWGGDPRRGGHRADASTPVSTSACATCRGEPSRMIFSRAAWAASRRTARCRPLSNPTGVRYPTTKSWIASRRSMSSESPRSRLAGSNGAIVDGVQCTVAPGFARTTRSPACMRSCHRPTSIATSAATTASTSASAPNVESHEPHVSVSTSVAC